MSWRAKHAARIVLVAALLAGCSSNSRGQAQPPPATTVTAIVGTTEVSTVRVTATATVTQLSTLNQVSTVTATPSSSLPTGWPPPNRNEIGDGPELTGELPHWGLNLSWDTSVRAFYEWSATPSNGADGDYGFPNVMNGCNQGLFLLRWRAVGVEDDSSPVIAGFVHAPTSGYNATGEKLPDPDRGDTATGRQGWMVLDQCEAPIFRSTVENSYVQVAVAVEYYVPSAR